MIINKLPAYNKVGNLIENQCRIEKSDLDQLENTVEALVNSIDEFCNYLQQKANECHEFGMDVELNIINEICDYSTETLLGKTWSKIKEKHAND